jgi:hypothetical protein
MSLKKRVYQFKITLRGMYPPIWRRIQVPSTYTFWDLHAAIQDAMGWSDCHLHKFRILSKSFEILVLGIPHRVPDDTFGEDVTLPDWKQVLSEYEDMLPKAFINYIYDYEDFWEHLVVLEKVISVKVGAKYPKCIKGKRACPPENCGGGWGYDDLLETLADPENDEYEEMREWVESQTGGPFHSEHFDPARVVFRDPKERLELMLRDI